MLVVVLVVNLNCIFSGERKRHSPVTADSDGPAILQASFESMQP